MKCYESHIKSKRFWKNFANTRFITRLEVISDRLPIYVCMRHMIGEKKKKKLK